MSQAIMRQCRCAAMALAVLAGTAGAVISARADIYLNGGTPGNDANDGLTPETAVKTFAAAKAKLAAQGSGIIKVMGQVSISSSTVLSFSDTGDGVSVAWPGAMVQRDAGYSNVLFSVNTGCALTLTNIVIDGNREQVTAQRALVYANQKNSSLTIREGAVLRNNKNNVVNSGGGAIIIGSNASFLMTGGCITNNSLTGSGSYGGGGIHVGAGSTGTFEMSGGMIADNTSASSGGAIGVFNSTFTNLLSGNTVISGNRATGNAAIGGHASSLTVVMSENALISNNVAGPVVGGGVSCSRMIMKDQSRICNNFGGREGGGLFCSYLTMEDDATICGNVTSNTTASYGQGAGVRVSGGALVMNGNASIRDNLILTPNTNGGGVQITDGASMTMNDSATICGNWATGSGGGVLLEGTGRFCMNSGSIVSNTSISHGGGLYITGSTNTGSYMSGGLIAYNTATNGGGGGIFLNNVGRFNLSGGSVVSNLCDCARVNSGGGGVYNAATTFEMSGGLIAGNIFRAEPDYNYPERVYKGGGGVFVHSGTFSMSGGRIEGNIPYNKYGRGAGVNFYNGTVKLSGAPYLLDDCFITSTALTATLDGRITDRRAVCNIWAPSTTLGTVVVKPDGVNVTDATQYLRNFRLANGVAGRYLNALGVDIAVSDEEWKLPLGTLVGVR